WNVYITWRHGKKVEVDDPWGFGASLEWATSCPPPRHNFTSLPRIRSERPALDLHHPELQQTVTNESVPGKVYGSADRKESVQ
ncbi:MAG: cytochrome ubiquinol oxidase subunit I, partial [Arthrobacter sp.]